MNLHEPNTIKVRLHKVNFDRALTPVKVLVTGDWHVSPIVSERQRDFLKQAIENTSPDVIILQGDLVDSPIELKRDTSLKKLYSNLRLCAKAAPTVMVLGSHDYITPTKPPKVMKEFSLLHWEKLCEKTGIKLLLDEWYEADKIRIFGSFQDVPCVIANKKKWHENPGVFLEQVKNYDYSRIEPSKVNWFAAHSPYLTKASMEYLRQFDIMSFGHTHGGIVPKGLDELMEKLHLHFGIVSPNMVPFPRHTRTAFRVGKSTLALVNPGMVGAQFCAPKITQAMNFIKAAEVSVVEVNGNEE